MKFLTHIQNKSHIVLGAVVSTVGLVSGVKILQMPLATRVWWGGALTPAHAAGWNILALASLFVGVTLMQFFPRDNRARHVIFPATIVCSIVLFGLMIASMMAP